MPGTRYVGGVDYFASVSPLSQEMVGLSHDDLNTLRSVNRMDRLAQVGARPQALLPSPRKRPDSYLLLTGARKAIEATKGALWPLLNKDSGLTVALHADDMHALRKPRRAVVAEMEVESGCRFVRRDMRDQKQQDPLDRKEHLLHLLGDEASQAHALRLVKGHSRHFQLPKDAGLWLRGFDPKTVGHGLELGAEGTLARRNEQDDRRCRQGCVAAGLGRARPYALGTFFSIVVAEVDKSCERLGDGFRLGVAARALAAPLETLASRPRPSWVVGGGRVRNAAGKFSAMPVASFDSLDVGDILGLLVTRDGKLAVFLRKAGSLEWYCVLHWAAGIEDPDNCYALIELSGRIAGVKLEDYGGPDEIDRPIDEAVPHPKLVNAQDFLRAQPKSRWA
mmetsp:Transcript_86691/g.193974  ORF Transcript_86691/g.193974 Transcript_86691/m.193974 type:complete len:393 (+) Transcript_86691:68-1246(+)|eukprot:CAMPEP_0180572626 /NCGR_PEP_ID=MMETSP1037_2-20121125/9345_1 /TAXON_ID=632150 /ORGANISM="Azadinium spinosum, Strain 3D9" /LENGTH=392 /DNA_ID=CAMNT_0022590007 /DNA_START=21 /DNA_END=1199 /DNA_ORIENTATION=-